ncbi:MAG: hypothetical protein RBR69_07855 [Candidatus Cloacimonadaceae bacterium]|nr:hypothetical protein [Candidatus Cloacimonadota bacterium]MDY0128029.1 hypothetical protein [Candidatus Cloacimonadaceae bacterium]MCB5254539.1 hypothetical protein [Candidatus Cloacimonadota bacterium]MCK9178793.1 hypothetical protein [Candidatus Cloacimonadota bacterium]MCK9242468.1 hypothetical protein [Candidatus Cloacimonadota bacterium]
MKKTSFALAILLLSCSSSLFAQSRDIEFYLYNSDNIRLLESSLSYQTSPTKHSTMNVIGQSSWEQRLNFNQQTRRSLLGSRYSYHKYRLMHGLVLDYESYFDASDLDPTAYINKNGNLGYQLHWAVADSLFLSLQAHGLIRNEQDRYLVGNYLKSDGYQLLSDASYSYGSELLTLGISGNLDKKLMDWEAYESASATAMMRWILPQVYWDNSFSISHKEEDIYNLFTDEAKQNSVYYKQDTQSRNIMNLNSQLDITPHELLEFSISEYYSERRTRLDNNIVRNNGEFYNDLQLKFAYFVHPRITLSTQAAHQLAIKDFSYAQNTRHIENRILGATAAWEYSEQDSLITSLGINLQRTYFPRQDNRWDNDLRTRNFRLGWKHYFKEYIRLGSWFVYSLREDVYLDSLLSANNHSLESFSFLPEIDILLGDRVAFRQSYQIRADYTDYYYQTQRINKLYRQVGYRYNLIFDSYPYLARSGDEKWLRLPYRRNRGSAFLIDVGYAYEENQYADQAGNYYNIKTKNRKHLASLNLKHDIDDFYYSLSPQYSWGTWNEYSLVAGASWNFNHGSYLELTLSPVSEDLREIDWRSSVNLSLRF